MIVYTEILIIHRIGLKLNVLLVLVETLETLIFDLAIIISRQ